MDAEIYCSLEESIPNMVDLLNKCQDFLAEHILTATTMRKNGDSSIHMSALYEELRKSWKKLEKVMHLSS